MSSATITVNGDPADFATAFNSARIRNADIFHQVLEPLLVRQHAAKANCTPSKEALQKAMDEARYQLGLEKADAFQLYLKSHNLTQASFEASVEDGVLRGMLLGMISDADVDTFLTENQMNLEAVALYSMRLEDKDTAEEIKSQLLDDDSASFMELAAEHSTDQLSAPKGGYVGALKRSQMVGEIEAAVFGAKEGDIVGPIKTPMGYNLFKVGKFIKPDKSDPNWRSTARQILFGEVLDRELAGAKVECSLLSQNGG